MEVFTPVPAEIPRDKQKRPLIIPPGGGEPVPYQRASSFGDVIEDMFGVHRWNERNLALGLAARPDLVALVAANLFVEADPNDERLRKKAIDDVNAQAKEVSGASKGSNAGTALHKVTERVDRGEVLPVLPEPYHTDIAAYAEATEMIESVHIERFLVCDYLNVAGTTDRLSRVGSRELLTVIDTKTGQSIDYGMAKIAVQLAIYANSQGYDPETGERTDLGIDKDWGMVVHLPSGSGECELVWINLKLGWSLALLSLDVRDARKLGKKHLSEPVQFEDLMY